MEHDDADVRLVRHDVDGGGGDGVAAAGRGVARRRDVQRRGERWRRHGGGVTGSVAPPSRALQVWLREREENKTREDDLA